MSSYGASEVIGRRIVAGLVDLFLVIILMIPVGLAFGDGESGHGHTGVWLHGVSEIVWVLVALAYYAILEGAFGWTLGKLALRLRVTTVNGEPAPASLVAVRTALRLIDFLPGFYLLGLIVMIATRHRAARIGDLIARTTVVAVPVRTTAQGSTAT